MSPARTSFESGGERCAAWVLRPAESTGPVPCVVLGHGFGATCEARLLAYAERFAGAGLAAVAFDYRHFGESEGEPRQLLDIGRQLEDWSAAVSFARSLDGVDPERIAVWGSSFGGGHAIRTAAADERIAAAVAQVPHVSGPATAAASGPRANLRLAAAALRDLVGSWRGRQPYTVPLVGPPGALAAMTTPDAEPGYLAMFESPERCRNEVAARIFLAVGTYSPGRAARRVRCPLLVQVAAGDAVTPPGPARRAARRAPRGELVEYPLGHFDLYAGEPFETAVADQIAFLRRTLVE